MAGPTPEQIQAINAMLQQTLQQDAGQPQQQSVPVSIQNSGLSVDISTLARALVLEGTAVAAGLDQLLMRTAQGEVLLKVQQAMEQTLMDLLPSRVTLQLRPGPDGLQAILVVGNKPVIPEKPVDSLSAGTSLAANQTLTAQIPKINQIYQTLVLPSSLFASQTPEEMLESLAAHVQGGASQGAPAPSGQTQTPPQNIFTALLQKLGIGPQTGAQTPTAVTPSVLASATTALSAKISSPEALLAPLQTTTIKIIAVVAPETAQKIVATAQDEEANVQTAIVRGNTPSGQPIISVGDKTIAVQGARNWPVGLELKVVVGPAAGIVLDKGEESAKIQAFSGLRQALEALALQSPGLYADIARLRLPQPHAEQLPGAFLFLLSALQKGAPAWLGDEFAQKLRELGKDQLIRLIQDQWRAQTNQEAEGPGGTWRGISIPVFEQDKMQALRFYIYDPPGRHGKSRKFDPDSARRFVIDAEFSRLGPVQLDGLVHRRRLDLVVRTARALESSLRSDLTSRYNRTLEEVRYTGTLNFAANRIGWVELRDKAATRVLKQI